MQLVGKWFAGGQAAHSEATLSVHDKRYSVVTAGTEVSEGEFADIVISDRLGQLERKLQLPDGSLFATSDNDRVDQIIRGLGRRTSWVARLESNWKWVAVALVLTCISTLGFFRWGLPWITQSVANALPHQTGVLIGEHTLEFLDEHFFSPSQIDAKVQDNVRNHFVTRLVPNHAIDDQITYTLHFRAWGKGENAIPNALALPSGDIILTDRFVELAESQDEMDAVLLHEMGHIEYRHTLEMVTQSTIVVVILAVFTGDVSSAGDLGIGLGSLLVTTGYSRRFENEADQFAFEHMLKAGINPNAFATIMDKISRFDEPDDGSGAEKKRNDQSWIDYLSTHPNTQERIARAKKYAQCFNSKVVNCTTALE